jgi:hypothetical protein
MNDNCIANNSHIILSFKYSVKNKNYTIDKQTKAKEKCNKIIQRLFEKLEEISQITWKELQNRPKETGYETIPISEFNFNFDNLKEKLKLSDDSKIIVFRFNNQKCRLLGVRSQECSSILYIIGYDWDYSAYNHGS